MGIFIIICSFIVLVLLYKSTGNTKMVNNKPQPVKAPEIKEDFPIKTFRTLDIMVSGTDFQNEDGVYRYEIIDIMSFSSKLTLQREPENEYDKNAIAVIYNDDTKIGYLPKKFSHWLAIDIDNGRKHRVRIKDFLNNYGKIKLVILVDIEVGNGFV